MNWKLAIIASGVAFALLTSALFVLAVTPVSTLSPYQPHDPIRIVGDKAFTAANGVRSGTGDASNPYVIEGWEFGKRAITAIWIQNTTAHYIIRDISVLAPLNPSVPGLRLKNSSFAQVSNVSIDGRSIAVVVEVFPGSEPVRDIFIMESRITNCPIGIRVNDTVNAFILDNTISAGVDAGIVLDRCTNAEISRNIISDSARKAREAIASIHIDYSDNVSIIENRVVLSGRNGIEINGSEDLRISTNKFEGLAYSWLSIGSSNRAEIQDNIARGLGNNSRPFMQSGLVLSNVTDCNVESNELVKYNIYMGNVSSGKVVSNRLTNGTGLVMADCSNSTVANNTLIGIESPNATLHELHALRIHTSQNMTVENNVVEARERDSGGVLELQGLDFSVFEHNVLLSGNSSATDHLAGRATDFQHNMMYRVALEVSGNNLTINANNLTNSRLAIGILDSTITGNSFWDVSGLMQSIFTDGTEIFHNNFMAGANVTTAPVAGNSWDDGYPSGGNYWADNLSVDDFSGVNQNIPGSDGIGDTNVTVPGGAVDRYPLMTAVRPTDTLAPISSATLTGPRGTNGWFVGAVNVTLKASDDLSGVASTIWRLDGGTWTFTHEFKVQDQQSHLLEFYSVDRSGNSEPVQEIQVRIDFTSPRVEVTEPIHGTFLHRPTMVVRWTSSDGTSGIAYDTIIAEGWANKRVETLPYLLMTSLPADHYTMHITAVDDAGNTAEGLVTFVITYEKSLASWHGPWGALFNLLLILDVLAVAAAFYFIRKYRSSVAVVKE